MSRVIKERQRGVEKDRESERKRRRYNLEIKLKNKSLGPPTIPLLGSKEQCNCEGSRKKNNQHHFFHSYKSSFFRLREIARLRYPCSACLGLAALLFTHIIYTHNFYTSSSCGQGGKKGGVGFDIVEGGEGVIEFSNTLGFFPHLEVWSFCVRVLIEYREIKRGGMGFGRVSTHLLLFTGRIVYIPPFSRSLSLDESHLNPPFIFAVQPNSPPNFLWLKDICLFRIFLKKKKILYNIEPCFLEMKIIHLHQRDS